jgi:hypothetical protein
MASRRDIERLAGVIRTLDEDGSGRVITTRANLARKIGSALHSTTPGFDIQRFVRDATATDN